MPAKLKQTVIRDIAAQNCCLLMLFSFGLVTECCSH